MSALGKPPIHQEAEMRVLIVDDHVSFLTALAGMLEHEQDIEIVGRAGGGKEGLRLAAETQPDLVVVDFAMPDINGVAVTQQLKAAANAPKVVMMSFHAEPEYRDMALDAGADAFVTKSDLHKELVPLLARLGKQTG